MYVTHWISDIDIYCMHAHTYMYHTCMYISKSVMSLTTSLPCTHMYMHYVCTSVVQLYARLTFILFNVHNIAYTDERYTNCRQYIDGHIVYTDVLADTKQEGIIYLCACMRQILSLYYSWLLYKDLFRGWGTRDFPP